MTAAEDPIAELEAQLSLAMKGLRLADAEISRHEEALRKIIALDPLHDDDGAVNYSEHCATCIAKGVLDE